MAMYSYKGLDRTGKEVKATVNSESISSAKSKIRAMGIMLIDIKEEKADGQKSGGISFGSPVSVNDLALMTRQLATLLKAKIQIVEAFAALVDQTDNPKLRVILSEVKQKINEGTSLSKALNDYPKVFNNVYVNMVDAGESSGTLDVVLLRLADFTEAQVKLKNKIRGALIYPVIMMTFGSLLMGIIFVFVIPKITKIFVTMKRELPMQTQICIWISDFLKNYWYMVIFGIIGGLFLFNRYINTKKGEARWHSFLLKAPIAGDLITMINVSRFCSTLGTLLASGVPILASMKIVKNLIGNVHMQRVVDVARDSVAEGGTIAQPLRTSGLFPTMVSHMIHLGEKSGELEPMLEIISDNYQDQVESKLSGLTATLEPIMMVFMGLAVSFVVFSVVVPMMEINSMR